MLANHDAPCTGFSGIRVYAISHNWLITCTVVALALVPAGTNTVSISSPLYANQAYDQTKYAATRTTIHLSQLTGCVGDIDLDDRTWIAYVDIYTLHNFINKLSSSCK